MRLPPGPLGVLACWRHWLIFGRIGAPFVAALALTSLASVRRRRRDLALLRTLGFAAADIGKWRVGGMVRCRGQQRREPVVDEHLDAFAACGRGERDTASLVAYHGVPLVLTTDDGLVALTSSDQVVAAVQQQVEAMRAAGYVPASSSGP